MRVFAASLLLVIAFASVSTTQTKRKNDSVLPSTILHAKYVMVTTMQGTEFSRNVLPEDRQVIAEVQDRLRKWNRYALAYKQEDADILLVVRRGRTGSVTNGLGVSIGSDHPIGLGPVGGAEAGPKEDMLAVYDAHDGVDQPPLWRRLQSDGLIDNLPLFQEFKRQVEAAKP